MSWHKCGSQRAACRSWDFLPSCEFQGLNSGYWAWHRMLLPISLAPDRVVWKLRPGLNSLCNPSWLQTCSPPRQVIFNSVLLIRKVRQRESKVQPAVQCCTAAGSASKPLQFVFRVGALTIQSPSWILLEMGSERDLTKAKSHRPAFHPSTGMLKRIRKKMTSFTEEGLLLSAKEKLQVQNGAQQQTGKARPETP